MNLVFNRASMALAVGLASLSVFSSSARADNRERALQLAAQRLGVAVSELEIGAEGVVGNIGRFKVVHKGRGQNAEINLNEQGVEVSAQELRQRLEVRRGRDFKGKFEAELRNRLDAMQPTQEVQILVWGKPTGRPPFIDRRAEEQGTAGPQIEAFKRFHKNAMNGIKNRIVQAGGRILHELDNAPMLVALVQQRTAIELGSRGDSEALYLSRIYRDELNVSVPAIDAPAVLAEGFNGSGVKVAVVEKGGIYFGHSFLADGPYCKALGVAPIAAHASGVAGIIASTSPALRGVAPGIPALLSGNAGSFSDADIITCTDWAITNGARAINYSFGVDASSSMVALDRYVDYLVRYRAVTMIKSAGNRSNTCPGTNNVTSPGKGWNIITVGNYDDRGTIANADDIISNDSCFEDPTSVHGDRQKPEIAAPGTSITTTFCTGPVGCTGTGSGTSFAAPHATGCAALLMQRKPALKFWPEGVKAILMASAVVNLEGSNRLSEKDGAGGIECDSASKVAGSTSEGSESHGSFSAGDFPKTFTFSATAGKTVRVAIAWDSNTNTVIPPTTDVLNADLDLAIYSPAGGYVTGSLSWDNSYEIVEFVAPATGTYSARVNAFRFDGSSEFLAFAHWKGTRED